MNKTQLLDYYSSHYTSRQEIMFKLPFSINADEFWQELLNRRKMNAVVLPLHNAIGKPYWYVMTEKMIKASELLCDEAMNQSGFDPFHSEMTSAMTLEMFFTSYVEGVQLDMQDGLEYLSQDIEPSDVSEQILFNNRQALTTMTGMLYYPIDERLTKHLSCLLTQELDGYSMDYRILGNADISLVDAGKYILPSPDIIPERMNELYSFLAQNNVHPLVKSAAAQAFILTTRPFTEGNERLSRIISSMILYRSGYDYFRDISISQKIASENYRYYAVMQEILQLENDGDLTCFMEYFIDLLARALSDSQREKQRMIEEKSVQHDQMIEQEKQMAHFPFVPQELEEAPAAEADDSAIFLSKYVQNNADARAPRLAEVLQSFLDENRTDFRRSEFIIKLGHTSRNADTYLKKALDDGLIKKIKYGHYLILCPKSNYSTSAQSNDIFSYFDEKAANKLKSLSESNIEVEIRLAKTIIHFIQTGKMQFYKQDWAEYNNLSLASTAADLTSLMGYGIIYRFKEGAQLYTYKIGKCTDGKSDDFLSAAQKEIRQKIRNNLGNRFTVGQVAELLEIKKSSVHYHLNYLKLNGDIALEGDGNSQTYCFIGENTPSEENDEKASTDFMSKINNLNSSCLEHEKRWGNTLLQLMSNGKYEFRSCDWVDLTNVSKSTADSDLKRILLLDIVKREQDPHAPGYIYTICPDAQCDNESVLSDKQKNFLKMLSDTVDDFNVQEASDILGIKESSFLYHLRQFKLLNIVTQTGGFPCRYKVNIPIDDDAYFSEYASEPVMAGACV